MTVEVTKMSPVQPPATLYLLQTVCILLSRDVVANVMCASSPRPPLSRQNMPLARPVGASWCSHLQALTSLSLGAQISFPVRAPPPPPPTAHVLRAELLGTRIGCFLTTTARFVPSPAHLLTLQDPVRQTCWFSFPCYLYKNNLSKGYFKKASLS